jgi:hypothetical protein
MTALETLKNCTVKNNIVYFPPTQLDRKVYTEVKKSLELIGGEWKSGKIQGFVFKSDPTDLLEQIASGEKRNLKKEFQFFATPSEIAEYMVDNYLFFTEKHSILEPSAGQGAIVNAINKQYPNKVVQCYELMDVNRSILTKIPTVELIGEDFLLNTQTFDRIIANPPFSKNQDIDHVYKMYESLNTGGRLVSIMSTHWRQSSNKKETIFRGWLENIDASIYPIQKGAFKESGTMIESCIVVIDKL